MAYVHESMCKICPYRKESVFSELAESRLDEFCNLKVVSHYQKNQRIFYEGEPNPGLHILCSGRVKLSRSFKSGQRQIIRFTGPCGLLGGKDLFLHNRHRVTAEALEESVVCFVHKQDLLEFLNHNPEVSLKMLGQLARELQQAEDRIEALTALDARKRLAVLLLSLGDQYGTVTPDGKLIEVALTREEMAEMVGTTQETVIRVLSAFRRERMIKDSERHILLTNEERLKRVAC
jgi:CRP/FNR family transcriptional regulator